MFGAVAALAGLLALSACTDDGEGDGVASAGGEENSEDAADTEEAASLDEEAQALVFAECMRENGVDMPDPGPGQDGLIDAFHSVVGDYDTATLDQAFAACEDVMPQYSDGGMHDDDTALALAECLRDQGLDVSDDPFRDAREGTIDQDELTAAMEVCRTELAEDDE